MGLLYYLKIRKTQSSTDCANTSSLSFFIAACIMCTGFFLFSANTSYAQVPLLEKPISIPKQNISLYKALDLISRSADCFFIYDSQVVESDKRLKLSASNEPLKEVLEKILNNPELSFKVIGQHILIYKSGQKDKVPAVNQPLITVETDSVYNILIRGHIFDNENKSAIPYATIGIPEQNIGTVTNTEGYFTLKVPSTFTGTSLSVSHMGYMSQRIPVQLIKEQKVDIYLERRIISIQEVIIRYTDPYVILQNAMERRDHNYSREPVYMTSFYREGVEKNKRYISYSEAVIKIYKSSYALSEHSDQVKLLKSRKIENSNPRDTVYLKLKAGVLTALLLDVVKNVPGFLDLTPPSPYTYSYSNLVSYHARDAYAITFVQREDVKDALYTGTLYIDKENYAILGADFEINPDFIDKAADDLVLKKSRKLIVRLEKINYSITYTPFNGRYYLNHARCDIQLKTRLRRHFSSDNFNTFLELATCNIDTVNVSKFPRQEVLKPNIVFSDANYINDETFWGDYNVIAPEAKLSEALSKIIGNIETIE